MLSILIPIYNENCTKLVSDLVNQAKDLSCPYEILVFDDFSPIKYEENKAISQLEGVEYRELPQNLGRSKIRNHLADCAKGDILLFLDGDSGIVRDDFLKRYLNEIKSKDIVRGGTVYCPKSKVQSDYFLHWKYGTKVETNGTRQREDMFTTNNFCLKKRVFESLRFDERIKDYGHEDTLFEIEFKKKGFLFKNIDNPVEHLGLKNFDSFISSTENAVRNLKKLYQREDLKDSFKDLALIKAANILSKLHLIGLYSLFFKSTRRLMLRMLRCKNPYLRILDLYKLGIYCIS